MIKLVPLHKKAGVLLVPGGWQPLWSSSSPSQSSSSVPQKASTPLWVALCPPACSSHEGEMPSHRQMMCWVVAAENEMNTLGTQLSNWQLLMCYRHMLIILTCEQMWFKKKKNQTPVETCWTSPLWWSSRNWPGGAAAVHEWTLYTAALHVSSVPSRPHESPWVSHLFWSPADSAL